MVSQVTSLHVPTRSGLTAAAGRAAPTALSAPAARGAPPATVRSKTNGAPVLAAETLGALIDVQAADRGRSEAAHLAHKKPKAPEPQAPQDPPAPGAIVDSHVPARFLATVRAQLREPAASQFPDVPFSKRGAAPAPQPPAQTQASPFYTPGAFSVFQASAMLTVAQAQAGIVLLQASLYGAAGDLKNPFRISVFA